MLPGMWAVRDLSQSSKFGYIGSWEPGSKDSCHCNSQGGYVDTCTQMNWISIWNGYLIGAHLYLSHFRQYIYIISRSRILLDWTLRSMPILLHKPTYEQWSQFNPLTGQDCQWRTLRQWLTLRRLLRLLHGSAPTLLEGQIQSRQRGQWWNVRGQLVRSLHSLIIHRFRNGRTARWGAVRVQISVLKDVGD